MLSVIILAAGKGTRMKSETPKVLFHTAGKPMIDYTVELSKSLNPEKIVVVTGNMAEAVQEHLQDYSVDFALQKQQRGTADAVMAAQDFIDDNGKVLILCGDMPLIKEETIKGFIESVTEKIAFISVKMKQPKGYGRVVRASDNKVLKIVEEKDANEYEKRINEVNTGVYLCDGEELKKRLALIDNNNAQNEYYLTDIVRDGAEAYLTEDEDEFMGVNDRIQLCTASKILYKNRAEKYMADGVSIIDPQSCYIDEGVEIGRDTIIYPNVFIENGSKIGKNVVIRSGCRLNKAIVEDNVEIKDNSLIEDSFIGSGSSVGPMAHLRPGSYLEKDNKVGNFVELKKAKMGEGSKASHLTYLGDAEIGKNVNIGCGTITCNYDGYNKYKTIIDDNVFIGSDTQIVAPVKIGKNVLVAAGSTVTKDVDDNALAISRTPQKNLENKGKEIMDINKAKKESKK